MICPQQPIDVVVQSVSKDRDLLVGVYCRGRLLAHRTVDARKETGTFAANVKDMLSGSKDQDKRTLLVMLIISVVLIAAGVWRWLR